MHLPGRRKRRLSASCSDTFPARLRGALASFALALAALPAPAAPFDDVAAQAERLSHAPYHAESATPKLVEAGAAASSALTYDQFRDIRFRPDHALWRADKLPFEVMFFHPGFVHTETVKINEVGRRHVARPVAFDTALFNYGHNKVPAPGTFTGYAGFRVHAAINRPDHKDEVIVFLGASYFRAVGKDQRYGLSARALAIDTVGGPGPEEFPRFTEFWLEKPEAGPRPPLVIEALMDSPSVYPAPTASSVHARAPTRSWTCSPRLFMRKSVATLRHRPAHEACSSRARTSRMRATSAPRCTTPTA